MDLEILQYTFKQNIMVGVNFASGGSGILRYTGYKQSVTSLILIPLLLVVSSILCILVLQLSHLIF